MNSIAGQKSGLTWAVHISVVLLVALWVFLKLLSAVYVGSDWLAGLTLILVELIKMNRS